MNKIEFFKIHHEYKEGWLCKKQCPFYRYPSQDSCGCSVLDSIDMLKCRQLIKEYQEWVDKEYGKPKNKPRTAI